MTSADGGVCTDYSDSFTMMTSQDQARLLATIKEVPGATASMRFIWLNLRAADSSTSTWYRRRDR